MQRTRHDSGIDCEKELLIIVLCLPTVDLQQTVFSEASHHKVFISCLCLDLNLCRAYQCMP